MSRSPRFKRRFSVISTGTTQGNVELEATAWYTLVQEYVARLLQNWDLTEVA